VTPHMKAREALNRISSQAARLMAKAEVIKILLYSDTPLEITCGHMAEAAIELGNMVGDMNRVSSALLEVVDGERFLPVEDVLRDLEAMIRGDTVIPFAGDNVVAFSGAFHAPTDADDVLLRDNPPCV